MFDLDGRIMLWTKILQGLAVSILSIIELLRTFH